MLEKFDIIYMHIGSKFTYYIISITARDFCHTFNNGGVYIGTFFQKYMSGLGYNLHLYQGTIN